MSPPNDSDDGTPADKLGIAATHEKRPGANSDAPTKAKTPRPLEATGEAHESTTENAAPTDIVELLVARVSSEDLQEALGLAAATKLAVKSINSELATKDTRRSVLQAEISRRKWIAMSLKGVTLLGGLGIISKLSAQVPGGEQAVAIVMFLATTIDAFAGNFLRLRDKIVEVGIIHEIEAAVAHATQVSIQVVRLAPIRPMEALRLYADFWQNLHSMIVERNDAVRQAAHKLELQITTQLDLAKKSGESG